jgi:acyl carrier protein
MDNNETFEMYRHLLETGLLKTAEDILDQEVDLDTPLRDEFDELDIMQLIMAVEELYGIEINENTADSIETLRDFMDIFRSRLTSADMSRFVAENGDWLIDDEEE